MHERLALNPIKTCASHSIHEAEQRRLFFFSFDHKNRVAIELFPAKISIGD
jgi:hypothetical protein